MFPKNYTMPKGNWKSAFAFPPTGTGKLPPKESKQRGDTKKSVETTKPKKKHKNGNTKREISKKTAEEVKIRDRFCIIPKCGMAIDQIHHCFYGAESNYGKDRNESHQLVGLCNKCHDQLHSRGGNEYREYCKKYLCDLPK